MKIFCTGLSRTGTTSICAGLSQLGLRSRHFPLALLGRPETIGGDPFRPRLRRSLLRRWQFRRELKALRCHDPIQILHDSDVFADLPVPLYYQELSQHFPTAKFIHTTRPIDDWLASMEWMLKKGRYQRGWTVGELADEMHHRIYGCTEFDADALRHSWSKHEASVAEFFQTQPDRLLCVDLSKDEMTFERIAPFLERPVPGVAFPTANAKSHA